MYCDTGLSSLIYSTAFSLRLGDGGHPSSMPSVSAVPVPYGRLYNHTHTAETEKDVAWICRDFCLHISGVRSQPHLGQKVVFTLGDHTPRICLWEKVKNDQLSVVRSPLLLAKLRWVYLKFIWFSMLLLTNVKNKSKH